MRHRGFPARAQKTQRRRETVTNSFLGRRSRRPRLRVRANLRPGRATKHHPSRAVWKIASRRREVPRRIRRAERLALQRLVRQRAQKTVRGLQHEIVGRDGTDDIFSWVFAFARGVLGVFALVRRVGVASGSGFASREPRGDVLAESSDHLLVAFVGRDDGRSVGGAGAALGVALALRGGDERDAATDGFVEVEAAVGEERHGRRLAAEHRVGASSGVGEEPKVEGAGGPSTRRGVEGEAAHAVLQHGHVPARLVHLGEAIRGGVQEIEGCGARGVETGELEVEAPEGEVRIRDRIGERVEARLEVVACHVHRSSFGVRARARRVPRGADAKQTHVAPRACRNRCLAIRAPRPRSMFSPPRRDRGRRHARAHLRGRTSDAAPFVSSASSPPR